MKRICASLMLCVVLGSGCARHVPPNLSPPATAAWYGTRAIEALDVIRNVAVDGNAVVPPVISTATTRAIVTYHKSAITIIHASPNGWRPVVAAGLDEVVRHLSTSEQQLLAPYVQLAHALFLEVVR